MTVEIAISVVIPFYNEEDNVAPLIDRLVPVLVEFGRPFEVICVNDGSRDGTQARLAGIAAADTRIKVISFRRNHGQTAAIMAGFDHAKGEIIVPMDGDLQNEPGDIPKLVAKLEEGYSVVSGWRVERQDAALRRRLPSIIANRLISHISGVHLHDYGCTMKAYRRSVIEDVRLYGEMHRFIPIYASWHGANVTEIPVRHHARIHGKSKYGLNRILKVVLDLIVVKFLEDYNTKPIYVFGLFGALCIAVSMASGLFALWLKLFEGIYLIQTPLPLLSVMTFVTGIMCVLLGLLAEMMVRVYYESQDRPTYFIREKLNLDEDS
ncbi:Glycosyl transferase family 2 [Paramagnetospirillum magnetotacticum MS-1]|uniref:Glycosyl transferase family 2 n=1 Tax=Paramagnetospirillum magnetotacticum MS-1 TaxID=272627 RepID=A0A0C2YRH1_PARME|nr:glycosyltransferase family 2 protein [Paramagnetospirillum magnetotacticum]KIL97728.1 Glycosyl transferase family 2 [Paramagnetospirillum magnetotacticum MS-1]